MLFFSVYDLLLHNAKLRGSSENEMFDYFRTKGIKKSVLNELKDTMDLSIYEGLLPVVLTYLQMSELEFELSLGKIPKEYRSSFFENLHNIANVLEQGVHSGKRLAVPVTPHYETNLGKLYNADCINVLKEIEDESVDLVFADPPFNLKKKYDDGVGDDLSKTEYINWCYDWIDECLRIIKPGGSIYIYNLPKWCTYLSEYLNKYLAFRQWIAIDMKNSLPINGRLSPSHYGLLYFTKGPKPNTFCNQRAPLQTCRHCGGEIKDYGGYKAKMNPAGVNVSDVWTDIYPVRHKNKKNREYNELSIKLLDRVISMSTKRGDLIVDPFGGSGTTYIVAELLGRKWLGAELGNCEIISDRFENIRKDEELLNAIQLEKSSLFPDLVKKLRAKNGFWLCEDFEDHIEDMQK